MLSILNYNKKCCCSYEIHSISQKDRKGSFGRLWPIFFYWSSIAVRTVVSWYNFRAALKYILAWLCTPIRDTQALLLLFWSTLDLLPLFYCLWWEKKLMWQEEGLSPCSSPTVPGVWLALKGEQQISSSWLQGIFPLLTMEQVSKDCLPEAKFLQTCCPLWITVA